jgi:hypothetical protein
LRRRLVLLFPLMSIRKPALSAPPCLLTQTVGFAVSSNVHSQTGAFSATLSADADGLLINRLPKTKCLLRSRLVFCEPVTLYIIDFRFSIISLECSLDCGGSDNSEDTSD